MLDIAIIGAGIGGLTAAATLAAGGSRVRVFEQASRFTEVGAGIQLSPNANKVLRRLGLDAALERVAVRPTRTRIRHWKTGETLLERLHNPQAEQRYGAPYLQLHRADLHACLASLVHRDSIERGETCVSIEQRQDAVLVRFASGREYLADVVIGADGLHSVIRKELMGEVAPRFCGEVAFRGVVSSNAVGDEDVGVDGPSGASWVGRGQHFIHYRISAGQRINCAGFVSSDVWTPEFWSVAASVEEYAAAFSDWHPLVRRLIHAIDEPFKWGIFDRQPLARWSFGRVTLLGDAAHPMMPSLAQGAAQAIEDACILNRCLEKIATRDVPKALEHYAAVRLPRTSDVQLTARRMQAVGRAAIDGPLTGARSSIAETEVGRETLFDWLYGFDALDAPLTGTN